MSKQIIVVKPKTLSPKDKEKLTKEGNIVIEHEKPTEIVYRQPTEILTHIFTTCIRCGDRIYITKERHDALKSSKTTYYCPQGHGQSYL